MRRSAHEGYAVIKEISIHAPLTGCDTEPATIAKATAQNFNPRPPDGVRPASPRLVESISDYSADDIMFFADKINGLPRKILDYRTPDELFEQELDRIYAA